MANKPSDPPSDDFLDQILGYPAYAGGAPGADPDLSLGHEAAALARAPSPPMMLQLSSRDASAHLGTVGVGHGIGAFHGGNFPLALSLEKGKGGFVKIDEASGSAKRFRDDVLDGRAAASSLRPVSVVSRCCLFVVTFSLC